MPITAIVYLMALCSVGPILAVLALGMFSGGKLSYAVPDYTVSKDILGTYANTFLHTVREVSIALGRIIGFFIICNFAFLHMNKRQLLKIAIGVVFTYIGLVKIDDDPTQA